MSAHLVEIGFVPGRGHPSVFHHPVRDVLALVHGDDYLSSGQDEDLAWLKAKLEFKYEIQTHTSEWERERTKRAKS